MACVWLPQLPLRVEVLRQPAWDGQPLVLGGGPGERKVVHLCSPEAEQAGIRPGLPLREVLPLCREAIVLQPDPVRIASVLEQALAALQRVSPSVEPAGECLFLDLRGLEGVYGGDLHALERAIRAAVPTLLRPRIGVAHGKFTASVAARVAGPSDLRVVPANEATEFLAALPVGWLEVEGWRLDGRPRPPTSNLQPPTFNLQRLDLLGLHTIGDLAALPFSAVQAQFGPPGALAWRLANGRDDQPVVPRRLQPSVHASLSFDDPLASVEAVMAAVERLLAAALARFEVRGSKLEVQAHSTSNLHRTSNLEPRTPWGHSFRQARLRALLVDGSSWERLYTFKEALSSRAAAHRALKSKLELPNGLPPAPVEELSLALLGLGGEAARQPSLLVERVRQDEQIVEAARQLQARYGQVPLYQAREVEPWSRIPERRWALVPCDL